MKRKVKLSTLLNIGLALALVLVVVFGYFYLRRQPPAPVEAPLAQVRRNLNQPPANLRNIYGPPSSPLRAPLAVWVAPNGRVYVADTDNNQVQVFDRDGKWIMKWGKLGRGQGEFWQPTGIIVRNNRVYVADNLNSRIQIFTLDGKYLGQIPDPTKHKGLEVGPLNFGADAQGNMYVATLGHEVLVFDRNDNLVRRIGRPGQGPGELEYPYSAAVDDQGRVWVADANNGRVQLYDGQGRFQMTFAGLVLPRGIAVDDLGRVYVVDAFQHKVFVMNQEGRQLFTFGERGVEEGQFNFPNTIAIGPDGRLYVADRENNRISVWGY